MENYILNKIKYSKIVLKPYPHIVIEKFLDNEFYEKLNLPNYDDLDNNVLFQDNKHSKKSVVDNAIDKSSYL